MQIRIHENLISAKQNMKTLTDKITKEVLAGRIAGPFQSPPFTNIQISPLGLVPKKENFVQPCSECFYFDWCNNICISYFLD
jgi:hypothetical protein